MISAKEARDNYDKYGILANKFIDKYIEPKIISASLNATYITVYAEERWYQGYSFKFTPEFTDDKDLDKLLLTSTILDVLKSNGYKVEFADTRSRLDEYHSIEDIVATISWDEVK